jgi:hypothetical protein
MATVDVRGTFRNSTSGGVVVGGTVQLWLLTRFTSPPDTGASPPAGSADYTTTSGAGGVWTIAAVNEGMYWVRSIQSGYADTWARQYYVAPPVAAAGGCWPDGTTASPGQYFCNKVTMGVARDGGTFYLTDDGNYFAALGQSNLIGTGTAVNNVGTTMTGTGTQFTKQVKAGDFITFPNRDPDLVSSVTDDTHLELNFGSNGVSVASSYRIGRVIALIQDYEWAEAALEFHDYQGLTVRQIAQKSRFAAAGGGVAMFTLEAAHLDGHIAKFRTLDCIPPYASTDTDFLWMTLQPGGISENTSVVWSPCGDFVVKTGVTAHVTSGYGYFYTPGKAGGWSGTPARTSATLVAEGWDTTTNQPMAYINGGWKRGPAYT